MPFTPPSYPTRYNTWEKELIVGVETSAPGTVAAGRLYREICRNISGNIMRDVEAVQGYVGVPAVTFGSEEFQKHDEGAFVTDFRNGGLAALSWLTILGTEALSGAGPYLHTGSQDPASTSIPTWTIWENQGDGSNVLQRKYATISGVSLSSGPSGGVVNSVSYTSFSRAYVAAPTPTVFVSGGTSMPKKTRQKGNAAVFNIYGSSGSVYPAKILSMDISATRAIGIVPNPNGSDPLDIVPGVLEVAGSITYYYNGAGANSLVRDASDYTEVGDGSHIHNVVWTDADTRTTTLSLWPLKFDEVQPSDGDTFVVGTANFVAYNDQAQANAASPALTNLLKIEIQNEYNGFMLNT